MMFNSLVNCFALYVCGIVLYLFDSSLYMELLIYSTHVCRVCGDIHVVRILFVRMIFFPD